jgi:hypothetical protein
VTRYVLLLIGCALPPPSPLALRAVDWNPTHAAVGAPADAADEGDSALLVGPDGALAVKAGVVTKIPGHFRAAAAIPAADGLGRWLVAVAGDGRLLRLRGGAFEDIGARYGVARVRDVCGGRAVAVFALDGEIAVADGRSVTRYPLHVDDLACGGDRVVGHDARVVIAVDLARHTLRRFNVAAVGAAADVRGRVIVATARGLYVEDAGGLSLRYRARQRLRSLSGGGGRVWFADGDRAGALIGDEVRLSPVPLPPGARLAASSSGDVWTLSDKPMRLGGGGDAWADSVLPVFARVCADCHLPGGRAGVDLSTAAAWKAERSELYRRVLVARDMPPRSYTFADADRARISAWLETASAAAASAK